MNISVLYYFLFFCANLCETPVSSRGLGGILIFNEKNLVLGLSLVMYCNVMYCKVSEPKKVSKQFDLA